MTYPLELIIDNPKRCISKNLKIEINIDSSVKKHEEFKSGLKFDLFRLFF